MRLHAAAAASAVVAAIVGISAVPAHAAMRPAPAQLGAPAARILHQAKVPMSADPVTNAEPSQGFLNACHDISTSVADNDTCDAAALVDFDAARQAEGLPVMTLPNDFDTLSVPSQLLAIANVERVDRGLAPVPGLSPSLNSIAQAGADADADPSFPSPFPGTVGTSNWAGAGNSVLLDDFLWMYDDGLGSPNIDCTASNSAGCWGHRDNILYPFDTPLRMGAAVTYGTPAGTSMTEEFIGGDSSDPLDPSTAAPPTAAGSAFTLEAGNLVLTTDTARVGEATLAAAGAGDPQQLRAVAHGAGWSVTPSTCMVSAAAGCTFRVRFDPPGSGGYSGSLTVSGQAGTQQVTLFGWQAPPRVSAAAMSHSVRAGHRARVVATVSSYHSGAGLADQIAVLQRKQSGVAGWYNVRQSHTHRGGHAGFGFAAHRSAAYRVAVVRHGRVEAVSHQVRIRVVKSVAARR